VSTTLEKLICEELESNRRHIVGALLKNVIPLLDDENKKIVIDNVMKYALLNLGSEHVGILVSNFEISDNSASAYLLDRIYTPSKNRDSIDIAVNSLNENYGNVLLSAIYRGDADLARLIIEAHHGRAIKLERSKDTYRWVADDIEIAHQFESMSQISNVTDFKFIIERLLKIVHDNKINQEDFIGDFFSIPKFVTVHDSTRVCKYSHQLPAVNGGIIESPELFLAFSEAQKLAAHKSMYSRIYCWVGEADADLFKSGIKYTPSLEFKCFQEPISYESLCDESALTKAIFLPGCEIAKPLMDSYPNVSMYLDPSFAGLEDGDSDTGPGLTVVLARDRVMSEMLVDSIFMGLESKPGFVLMSVDISELNAFSVGTIDRVSLDVARKYTDDFYCSSLLSPKHLLHSADTLFRKEYKNKSLAALFDSASEIADGGLIFDIFDKAFWANIFKASSTILSAESILQAKKRFSLTNLDAPLGFKLSKSSVIALHENGYRFEGEMKAVNVTFVHGSLVGECNELFLKVIEMNAWPSREEVPESVEDALKIAYRKQFPNPQSIYVKAKGVEEAIAACKTDAQYKFVMKLFNQDELRAFAHKMPLKYTGEVFSNDLGI